MIKASDIIYLLEHWMTGVKKEKFEVLENPRSWRAAVSAFKDDIRASRHIKHFDSLLRFSYYSKQQELKVWVAYHAIHDNVVSYPKIKDCWCGWIDVLNREVNCLYPYNSSRSDDFINSLDSLPRPLERFLSGLELNNDLET